MKLRLPNGVVTSYTYDMHDRLTTLVTRNASGDVLSAFRYHLDPVGNRTGMDLNQNGATNYIRYGFDGAYRLTSETRKNEAGAVVYSESFDYDAVGNRIRQVKNGEASVYTYNRNNQLEEILANGQTVKHAYDKNGNLIRKRGPGVNETYKYDELNRMTEFASRGKGKPRIERHTYRGAEWHRASTYDSASGETTRYLYDGDNVVADLQNGAGVALYVTPFLDQNLSVAKDGTMHYYSHDGLGSVRLLTDAAGNVENRYDYTAFGSPYETTSTTASPQTVDNRYTYTGREHSLTSGLNYHRYRWADPALGRWTARDPIGYAGGVNVYGYVGNRPTFFSDPSGFVEFKRNKDATMENLINTGGGTFGLATTVRSLTGKLSASCVPCNSEQSQDSCEILEVVDTLTVIVQVTYWKHLDLDGLDADVKQHEERRAEIYKKYASSLDALVKSTKRLAKCVTKESGICKRQLALFEMYEAEISSRATYEQALESKRADNPKSDEKVAKAKESYESIQNVREYTRDQWLKGGRGF